MNEKFTKASSFPKKLLSEKPSSNTKEESKGFLGITPISMFIYGPAGIGKTSFAANFEDVGFLIDGQELGIRNLTRFGLIKKPIFIKETVDFATTILFLKKVAKGEMNIKTLALDSFGGFEKQCFEEHCEKYFEGNWTSKGFYSYQAGPKNAAKTDWPRFQDALGSVLDAGINIIGIGHSTKKPYSNPLGNDYDRFIPALDAATWEITSRWFGIVAFYNKHVDTEKKGAKTKAKLESEMRFLYLDGSAGFDAKNQFGLESSIQLPENAEEAYKEFENVFRDAYNKNNKVSKKKSV